MDRQPNDPGNTISSQTIQGDADAVESFMKKAHPRPLTGPWKLGWALGFHSSFSGGDWSRSSVGDLTYRLKYQGDTSVLEELVEQAAALMVLHPEIGKVDFILPVPSTTQRKINPVHLFGEALGRRTGIDVKPIAAKSRANQPQKEMTTLSQKLANVRGVFKITGEVREKRILVVDDLFDSGATLQEITRLLKQNGAIVVNVLTFNPHNTFRCIIRPWKIHQIQKLSYCYVPALFLKMTLSNP